LYHLEENRHCAAWNVGMVRRVVNQAGELALPDLAGTVTEHKEHCIDHVRLARSVRPHHRRKALQHSRTWTSQRQNKRRASHNKTQALELRGREVDVSYVRPSVLYFSTDGQQKHLKQLCDANDEQMADPALVQVM
jgi:hypothetical protein